MKILTSARGFGIKKLKILLAATTMGMALAGGVYSLSALAATPPANTTISNVATASYTDGNGVTQTANSNQVSTTIQQVGSFTLTPPTPGTAVTAAGYSKSAAPGSTVYVQYTINNTGNGSDAVTIATTDKLNTGTFSAIAVYPDVTSSGSPSSSTPITAPVTVAGGASYSFVVAYSIPASATSGWTDQADVKVTAGNAALGYTNLTLTRTDTVTATSNAAFSVTKALALPAIGAQSYWTGGTSAAAPSSGKVGTYSVYTLSYVNNGGSVGPVYIKDQVPAGFTYVPGSGAWSGAIGTALSDADSGNPAGISYKAGSYSAATGTLVEAVVQNVQPGQSGTLSFQVQAYAGVGGANTLVGTTSTSNTAAFTSGVPTGAACVAPTTNYTVANCNGSTTVATNSAPFTVLASRSVIMTGTGDGGAVAATSGVDTTAPVSGNAAGDAAGGKDTVTVASGVPGAAIRYSFKVYNKGNATDTFVLGLSAAVGSNTFPAGTTFNWFQADGTTPLQITAGGASVDTGPLAAGANTTVVLQVVVPGGTAAPATGAPLYTATVQATSVSDSTVEDGAKAQLTALSAGYVDLTQLSTTGTAGLDQGPGTAAVVQGIAVTAGGAGNNAAAAVGPTPAPTASAAGSAVFPLYVSNNDTGPLTFALSAGATSSFPSNLPAGWTVDFYTDAAATLPAAGSAGARTTGPVAAGAVATVYAKVTPASNTAAGVFDVYFQAKSTTNASSGALVSDYLHDQITVAAAGTFGMNLGASGALQASAGGSATYAHKLLNTGTGTCGSVGNPLTLTVSGLPSGWTYSAYLDTGVIGVIDGESPLVGTGAGGASPYSLGTLATAANLPLLVRVFPPASAAVGDIGTVTLTVSDANNPGCGTTITTDTTTVVATGQMQVLKYQSLSSGTCGAWVEPTSSANITTAKPGDCLMFKAVATNVGTTGSTNVSISDVVPAYTTWAATQPSGATPACVSSTAYAVALSAMTSGAAAGTTFTCSKEPNLPPNGTLILRFAVQINP